jgi:Holliday junction DNA helicase RuvA
MIRSISGILKVKGPNFAVVEVGGIGFKLNLSIRTAEKLPKEGEIVAFATYLHVREDALELYGFADVGELNCFEALTSVSGVGPRSALAILAVAPVQELIAAIGAGSAEFLTRAPGIGHKTAERIILELRDRMKLISKSGAMPAALKADDDVYEALRSLGYSANQAKEGMAKIDPNIKEVGARLRDALQKIKS